MSKLSYFDVVVVGGGPSGSSAAITAVRAGLKVCVIDKQIFPREKLCGGLVTPRSKAIFETVFGNRWRDELFRESSEVAFVAGNENLAIQSGYKKLYFTMRRDFDFFLLNLAKEAGAQLLLGVSIESVNSLTNTLEISTGDKLSFKILCSIARPSLAR